MSATARRSFSTNVTCDAPRLSASRPSAPVPAYPSSTRAPTMRGARILNSVSRNLSDVGRTPSHFGVFSRRPLNSPAMTRKLNSQFPIPNSRAPSRVQRPATSDQRLTHLDQPELLLPSLLHE